MTAAPFVVLRRRRIGGSGGGGAWTPASLFTSGEVGAWYEPGPSTCFTDTAGTTAAGVGDAVARINDSSGNGNHATQGTAAARPILRQTAGGLYYLEFDGIDDTMTASYGGEFSEITRSVAYRADNSGDFILDDDNGDNRGSFWSTTTAGNLRFFSSAALTGVGGWVLGDDEVAVATVASSGAGTLDGSGNSATASGMSVSTDGIRLGCSGSGSSFLVGRVYAVVDLDRVITAEENTQLQTYLAGQSGVTL